MVSNQYDVGAQQDFDNMTNELAGKTTAGIYTRDPTLSYEGYETDDGYPASPTATETVFMQELDSTHEMVAAGQLNVGDVRFTFLSDSIVSEEDKVTCNGNNYKVLGLTKVRNMSNNIVLYIKAFGKKVPGR